MEDQNTRTIKILCPKLILPKSNQTSLQWLITSPFLPNLTIISTVRCLHFQPSDHPFPTPDVPQESASIRSLIIRGFHVAGALIPPQDDAVSAAKHAINVTHQLREELYGNEESLGVIELIGGVISGNEVKFFTAKGRNLGSVEAVEGVVHVDDGGKEVWERGCLIKCGIDFKLPIYVNASKQQDAERIYQHVHEAVATMFKEPQVTYILEQLRTSSDNLPRPVIIRGSELDFKGDISNLKVLNDTAEQTGGKLLFCSYFCPESKHVSPSVDAENADTIQVTVFSNKSVKSEQYTAPVTEYYPAPVETTLRVLDYKLEVICYAVKDLPLTLAISNLIIPALVDQLTTMKNTIALSFLNQPPQLCPFHFCPPGLLHPVTAIYEMSYGETELKQVEARRSLHIRLGLPSDRPLLRIANALNFAKSSSDEKLSAKKGYPLLKDVHLNIPGSGVSGGLMSLVQGSYEYHHYLQGGFDDNGWGCAYRSLQTIISWFKLQHYTAIDVPTHREIQEALVEIGDKDPSFIGSREWIGAIELSYVLDKLLGVTCKVINVRSGAELPEKCRELALHFETQGTPIMIGGGVLAYTLLGVDYNDASGDCAFLILDPHYTGTEDLKKILNSGWCGWKKAIDSKGKSFFLADKFYNLLLPQRPNMV